MIVQEVQQVIPRPTAEVYDFVVTHYVENHPRWDASCIRTQLDGGAELSIGATGEEVRKQMGRETTYKFRVTELTGDHVTFEATGGGTSFGATWSVVALDEASSRLTISYRLGMGGVMRLFEPIMRGGVRKQMTQAAQRINALVGPS